MMQIRGAVESTLSFSSALISKTVIVNNFAMGSGGGVACFHCSLDLQDSVINYNTSSINGGGIHVFFGALDLQQSIVQGNLASETQGGGGGLLSDSSPLTVSNSLFADNKSSVGGGIYFEDDHAELVGNTIVRNIALESRNGGGVVIGSGTMNITNTIAWGNIGKGFTFQTSQVDAFPRENTTFSHCNIQSWNGFFGGIGNFQAEPRFVDEDGPDDIIGASDDDLRLSVDSPCVNRGDPSIVQVVDDTDLDSNPRLQGCRTDIGAYESIKINIDGDYDNDDLITLADYAKLQLFWGAIAGTSNEADTYICIFDTSNDGEVNLEDLPDFVEKLEEFSNTFSVAQR